MLDDYIRIDLDGRPAYIRRNAAEPLREVSTLLFDCDGVLIDARVSYDRSIGRTVSYLAREVLRTPVSEAAISDRVLYAFRKSGGFNNDWDTTYAILLYLFTRLPEGIRERFQELYRAFENEGVPSGPYERVLKAKRLLAGVEGTVEARGDLETELLELAEKADSRGLVSLEASLLTDDLGEALKGFSLVMSYPGRIGVSTVVAVFEEFFLGADLFYMKYGIRPRFVGDAQGLVADERPLVNEETLSLLAERFGESGLGIVSGRSRITAEYTLGDLLKRFNPETSVFVEDDISDALKTGDDERARRIGKPSPYALLKAEKRAPMSGRILYVGDSKEDLIMVERANQVADRFIAGGVYGCASAPTELMSLFMEDGVYLIAESVNDLYSLFKTMER